MNMDRKPQIHRISCSLGEECAFRVNALLVSGVLLRVIQVQEHSSKGGSVRKCLQKTALIMSITDAVDKFVVCEGRRAGNNAQLQQMVKEENGLQGLRDT